MAPPKGREVVEGLLDIIKVVTAFVLGAFLGGIAPLAVVLAVEFFVPYAFGNCEAFRCIHPLFTVFVPLGAFAGGVAGVVLLALRSKRP